MGMFPDHERRAVKGCCMGFADFLQIRYGNQRIDDTTRARRYYEWVAQNYEFHNRTPSTTTIFDVEEEYAKEIRNPYSRRFDEYKRVFDNEVENLSNEYTLRVGKKGINSGTRIGKSIGKWSIIRFDHQELRKVIWYVLHNSPEIDTYQAKFKSEFPNQDMKEEFPGWFGSQIRQRYTDKDPGVSSSGELFALACRPTSSTILVNSCVVNGVRFVIHSCDERHTTQNNGICSPSEKDEEMYYGQLEEILNLDDLDFATLNIDGQSIDVDAPPDIIVVDEDDDLVDDEDVLPYDLADSDDEDLANNDDADDDVVVVYSSEEQD
ncbi:hypothetical protein Tco_1302337 [Tanacetum coccineum]